METSNSGNQRMRWAIIALVTIVIILVMGILVFLMPKGTFSFIRDAFESNDEYTLNLDEFVVNLNSEGRGKSYLKVGVSIMYRDKKAVKLVESSQSKIRDIVLNNLRTKTVDEMLDVEETDKLKETIRLDLNKALGQDLVKDIYYTNLIVQ